ARRKRSEGKATWPGRKQVWRQFDDAGGIAGDTVGMLDEAGSGTPLLEPVMRAGRRLAASPALDVVRERVATQLDSLPPTLRLLKPAPHGVPVIVSPGLKALAEAVDQLPH
ncbi:hypothetical protein V6O07_03855, partial [Arthrospira platensis SPKY2]